MTIRLDRFRKHSIITVCSVVGIALGAFSLIYFVSGNLYLSSIIGSISLVAFFSAGQTYVYGSMHNLTAWILLIGANLASLIVLHELEGRVVYWLFVVLAGNFAILSSQAGLFANMIFIPLAILIISGWAVPIELARIFATLSIVAIFFHTYSRDQSQAKDEIVKTAKELQEALDEIKTLRGFISICAWCHKIRNEEGTWDQLEKYITDNSDAVFSHGICPDCADKTNNGVSQSV